MTSISQTATPLVEGTVSSGSRREGGEALSYPPIGRFAGSRRRSLTRPGILGEKRGERDGRSALSIRYTSIVRRRTRTARDFPKSRRAGEGPYELRGSILPMDLRPFCRISIFRQDPKLEIQLYREIPPPRLFINARDRLSFRGDKISRYFSRYCTTRCKIP